MPIDERSSTEQRVTRVESQLETLTNDVRELTHSVRKLADNFQASRVPQWGIMLTGIGVLFVGIGIVSRPYISDVAENRDRVRAIELEQAYSSGLTQQPRPF